MKRQSNHVRFVCFYVVCVRVRVCVCVCVCVGFNDVNENILLRTNINSSTIQHTRSLGFRCARERKQGFDKYY